MTEKSSPEQEQRKEEIAARIAQIRRNVEEVRAQNGIAQEVTLLAATKTVSPELINFATQQCGVTDIGENRVQELLEKYDRLDRKNVRIHFIGTLQPNKVKYIIDKVDLIHSLDSLKLAKEIDRQAEKVGRVMDVLIEINSGREPNKGGVMPEDAERCADEILTFPHLRLCGVMTIGPICAEKAEYQKIFTETYRIFIDISEKKLHNISRRVLSMGMSDNYEDAVACGSGLIRIGTGIFGRRAPVIPRAGLTDECLK